jgi:high-affinity iron transporter
MPTSTYFEAAFILGREGLEALLVLSALAAYLTRMGAESKLWALYTGAGLAVLASVVAAWVFERFYGGQHNDLIEGVVILVSAVLMFYVSGWLLIKQDPKAWSAYLRCHTDKAVSGTLAAVTALSFFAVFREGAETVLFLHALAKTSGGWTASLVAGIATAALILCGLFYVVTYTSRRLPLRWVFIATSAFLFVMGLKFVGQGLKEFQEQALVPYDPLPFAAILEQIGLNPTFEAIGVQIAVVALAAISLITIRHRGGVAAA